MAVTGAVLHELNSLRRLASGVWQGATAEADAQAGRDLFEAVANEDPFSVTALWAELSLQYRCVAELEAALGSAECAASGAQDDAME